MAGSSGVKSTRIAQAVFRRELAVFLPAIGLTGLWFGAAAMSFLIVIAISVAWATRPVGNAIPAVSKPKHGVTGLPLRAEAIEIAQDAIDSARQKSRATACLVLGLDSPQGIARQLTPQEYDILLRQMAERLTAMLRNHDRIAWLDDGRFAIILQPTPRPDLESMIQLAGRLQKTTEAPLSIAAQTVSATVHVGFCLMNRAPDPSGTSLLAAAELAAEEAKRFGPSAIRAYSVEIQKAAKARSDLVSEIASALDRGEIEAHYQPQISTDTGDVTGVQALPRWRHPDRGILSEADILPAVEAAGLQNRFAEVILFHCFGAIQAWQKAGLACGSVSVPISCTLLNNPKLAERMKWEFDRFSVKPGQLRLILQQSVLPQVMNEIVAKNLRDIIALGCPIEVAGFGNGPTSIANLRHTGANRLRIHRSFVAHVDQDPEQQRLIAAIVSMADSMQLDTIAEGVQTIAEHAMLAQLGCKYVQGRAISPPLPQSEIREWVERHRAKLKATPVFSHKRRG